MGNLSKNFSISEFGCKCGCGFVEVNGLLLYRLQAVRDDIERPIVISSGCRCAAHNLAVGGGATSAHLTGEGVDIKCRTPRERLMLVASLLRMGFIRIGIGKDFIHADVSETLDQNVLWLY